ncbi:MAG: lipoprotein-releasing system ATP-binding protein [Verrucomicrobiales bacterium]|jgi:lipoprotein-releasing system ATP-binding protein
MSAIVELKNISKSFEDSGGRVVLDGVDFTVEEGDRISIIGPSGCGKSTLLNIVGTLDRPTAGEVLFGGENLDGWSDNQLAKLRADQIGFIFQLHHLLPQCSVLENVLVPTLASKKFHISEAKERAQQLLEKVGLTDHLAKRPGQLSGGERQRVAVVRSLINQPKLLLADEPTGALDEENASMLVELLIEVGNAEGVAIVMVTHSTKLAQRMRSVRQLKGGKMV